MRSSKRLTRALVAAALLALSAGTAFSQPEAPAAPKAAPAAKKEPPAAKKDAPAVKPKLVPPWTT